MIYLLALLLSCPSAHATHWSFQPDIAVVKVESFLKKDSENKLEGSGFLFYSGGWKVLTSEHVVLPGNDPVYHRITTGEGYVMEAKWLKSDWEKGLALLAIEKKHPNISIDYYPDLENMRSYAGYYRSGGPDVRLAQLPRAWGIPAGTIKPRRTQGRHVKILEEGEVLTRQRVLVLEGLDVEFGMSGGPAFYEQYHSPFLGVVTHITYDENPQTFIIPADDVFNWLQGYSSISFFSRTVEDFQYLFFSKARGERVHLYSSDVTVEKRGNDILVNLPRASTSFSGGQRYPGLDQLLRSMEARGIRTAKIAGAGKQTLAQFLGGLTRGGAPSYADAEGSVNAPGLTNVPNFLPRPGQKVEYRALRVTLKGGMMSDTIGGPLYYGYKKIKQNGWVSYWFDDYEGRTLRTDKRFDGDIYNPGGETLSYPKRPASSDWWRDKAASCESDGGVMEDVTVPAGKYRACKVREGSGVTWYGPVPIYGIVKSLNANGSTYELESLSYGRER